MDFVRETEPRLRRALVSRYGFHDGRDAAAAALAWGFEHWDDLRIMANPGGYLYRVGCSDRKPRKTQVLFAVPVSGEPMVEPVLGEALALLTPDQRVAVVLTACYEWTLAEVAEWTGSTISTVSTHRRRGLAKLRRKIGVEFDGR